MRLCIGHGGDLGEPSGGTDRVSALAAGLAERGAEVTLVAPTPTAGVPDRLAPVDCSYVDTPPSSALRAAAVARRAAQTARRDGAVLQLEHSTLAGVGTLSGINRYVLDMHDLGYSRFDHVDTAVAPLLKTAVKRLEKRGLSRADHIVVVSDVMANLIQQLWEVPERKISVVPNGYFPETIEPFGQVSTETGRVVFLGTLHPKVDIETIVSVANSPSVREMVVIGDGAQRDRVESAANRCDSLRTTGRLPDAEAFELVASAEAVINPQTISTIQRSSSPVKLYYYAALGKPMVVTPGPSVVEELVRHEAAITARSRRHFVDRVQALLEDAPLARRVGKNARQVAEQYIWAKRLDAFNEVHRMLTESRESATGER
ncbi:glycosyltransferase [Halobacteriaceae archaeon SHR40]|uniref:glycosyltransferase n=1 Tax=Halovenus amylolytica TaxID=2500550 RepID=UPI000FE2E598